MSLSIVIVDDEPVMAQRLARLARKLMGREVDSIECASDIPGAIALMDRAENTVLLLDLNLSGGDGFELLRQALAQPCQTVVICANIARAMDAFELGVVDFVPKPFTEERLLTALQRAKQRAGKERVRYLAVTLAGKLELIPLDTVVAIHGDDDYSSIETLDGRRHLHRKTLASLLKVLPPTFKRVHRSHIVNLAHVERIVTHAGGRRTVQLPNGVSVPASRSHMEKLSGDLGPRIAD